MTTDMSGMVMDVSATLVERTILTIPFFTGWNALHCSAGVRVECNFKIEHLDLFPRFGFLCRLRFKDSISPFPTVITKLSSE